MNGHSSDNRSTPRNICSNYDTNSASAINTIPVGPLGMLNGNRNKSNNICSEGQDSLHQNPSLQNNMQNPDNAVFKLF